MKKLIAWCIILYLVAFGPALAYDPFAISHGNIQTLELTVQDTQRQRSIPLLVYLPLSDKAEAVILYSHGLGGSRYGSSYLGKYWASHGYIAIFIQHPGSDESVWKDRSMFGRLAGIKGAASVENFKLRIGDVPAVLNQLSAWNAEPNNLLYQRLDLTRLGMSGHSFGAKTTQALSGQKFVEANVNYTDPRIKAAIAFSPSTPSNDESLDQAFSEVSIPWLLMTGTQDEAALVGSDAKSRLEVYPALPPGSKYELVLYGAEHFAFTDRDIEQGKNPRNPNHHRVILGLSTAFWDSYLRGDPSARAWLDGESSRSIMEPQDRWQKK